MWNRIWCLDLRPEKYVSPHVYFLIFLKQNMFSQHEDSKIRIFSFVGNIIFSFDRHEALICGLLFEIHVSWSYVRRGQYEAPGRYWAGGDTYKKIFLFSRQETSIPSYRYRLPLTEEIRLQKIGSPDHTGISYNQGTPVYSCENLFENLGTPMKTSLKVMETSVKTCWNLGSRNYFESDLLCLWIHFKIQHVLSARGLKINASSLPFEGW